MLLQWLELTFPSSYRKQTEAWTWITSFELCHTENFQKRKPRWRNQLRMKHLNNHKDYSRSPLSEEDSALDFQKMTFSQRQSEPWSRPKKEWHFWVQKRHPLPFPRERIMLTRNPIISAVDRRRCLFTRLRTPKRRSWKWIGAAIGKVKFDNLEENTHLPLLEEALKAPIEARCCSKEFPIITYNNMNFCQPQNMFHFHFQDS